MTRIIKASEVKPGMEVEWTHAGITRKCIGSVVESAGPQRDVKLRTFEGGAAHIPRYVEVTVLSEPQPEEPTAGGARVVVDGRRFLRADDDSLPWVELDVWDWHNWDGLCQLGTVMLIPDQGWTVPDTPEVPERIEEWPANNEHLRGHRWRDRDGDVWFFDDTLTSGGSCWRLAVSDIRRGAPFAWPIGGPWERVTDA